MIASRNFSLNAHFGKDEEEAAAVSKQTTDKCMDKIFVQVIKNATEHYAGFLCSQYSY